MMWWGFGLLMLGIVFVLVYTIGINFGLQTSGIRWFFLYGGIIVGIVGIILLVAGFLTRDKADEQLLQMGYTK